MKLNFYPYFTEMPKYNEHQNKLGTNLNPKNHNNFFVFIFVLILLSYIFYKCSFHGQ